MHNLSTIVKHHYNYVFDICMLYSHEDMFDHELYQDVFPR